MQIRDILTIAIAIAAMGGGVAVSGAPVTDTLEDIGTDGTVVSSRIIDGVTVSISTLTGVNMTARTYYDATFLAFWGAGGSANAPLSPDHVSGARFISSVVADNASTAFPGVEPIVFQFSEPVLGFGLTTIDLLENNVLAGEFLTLEARDTTGQVVATQTRTGPQGASGLDLDWFVASAAPVIVEVRLSGSISGYGGYGIDDLVLDAGSWVPVPLSIAPLYAFSVDQASSTIESVGLTNSGTEERTATLAVLNPHDEPLVSLQSQDPVVVPPGETVEVTLDIDAGTAAAGLYDGILLEVAVDDGSTLYSNLEVQVVDVPRPDLALTTGDLSAVRDEVAGTATLQAMVHNQGQEPAANVEVAFYEFGTLLGTTTIDAIPAGESAQTSLVVPIANDGDHLFRVVADPNAVIAEGDETNNEASFVVSWNTPAATEGLILVTGNLPSTVYADSLFALAGQAVYELYIDGERNIDYVVKGGSVTVTIKAEDGTEWHYGGIYTDVNGDFRKTLLAPTVPGTYRVLMTVSDETFSGTRELVVTVEEAPAEEPAPPPAPTTTGEGYWSYELVQGEWVWVWYWDTLPVGEPVLDSDLWGHSEDLYFSDTHPAADDEITVFALLHYWAESTALLAENVPVNLYAIDPASATRALIGQTLIPSLTVGPPDYGLRYVYATWRNRGDGIYLIETQIDPSYQEDNLLNNAATRAILVGDVLPSGQGAIAGQVTSSWGGVADVVVRVLADDGSELASTLTDATGYYLAESIPVGEQDVHIEVPDGYTADPASQPVIVEDQAVSSADFALTLACNPPEQPTGLKVALTRQYAFLRWSASEGAEEYVIYRRIDGQDPFQQIGTSTQTTFRDRDYGRDDEFDLLEYYVVATNGCGASEPSDVATVRPRGRQ